MSFWKEDMSFEEKEMGLRGEGLFFMQQEPTITTG